MASLFNTTALSDLKERREVFQNTKQNTSWVSRERGTAFFTGPCCNFNALTIHETLQELLTLTSENNGLSQVKKNVEQFFVHTTIVLIMWIHCDDWCDVTKNTCNHSRFTKTEDILITCR